MNRIVKEYRVFAACSFEMRALLIANAIYALVLPVIEIFVAAYVLRNSHRASRVVLYQLAIYAATPVAFLLNGYLLRVIAVKRLYAAGMFFSGAALLVLMLVNIDTITALVLSGALMGLATGVFWANRGFLCLATTNDQNRNYFYGIETGVMSITSVIVPLGVGTLVAIAMDHSRVADGVNLAYRAIAVGALVLTTASAAVVMLGSYQNPRVDTLLFLRSHPLWYRLLAMAVLRGLGQGYIVTAPALLILKLVGQEGTLGSVEAIGSCVAALCLYIIGRVCKPEHRVYVLAAGLSLFFIGSAVNAESFNATGALIFMACLILAKPLIDLAYFPIELRTIDVVSDLEDRDRYAYILNHEAGLFIGRLVGCTLFVAIAAYASDASALRYSLLIVAVLQLPAIHIARRLPA